MSKVTKNVFFKPGIVFLSLVMLMSIITPSISAATNNEKTMDSEAIKKAEQELKFYFETVGEFDENGKYIIKNHKLFQEKLDEKDPNAIKLEELSKLNYDESMIQPYGATSFAKCVVNKFVHSYGNIARQFMNGAIYGYIKSKQYDLAARLMFKTLTKAGIKVNAVGLAAELSYYGWKCRSAW